VRAGIFNKNFRLLLRFTAILRPERNEFAFIPDLLSQVEPATDFLNPFHVSIVAGWHPRCNRVLDTFQTDFESILLPKEDDAAAILILKPKNSFWQGVCK
jgi:hypothetical protein